MEQRTSLITVDSRKNAIKEGLNHKFDTLIFDDGLQEMKIDFDLKLYVSKQKLGLGMVSLSQQDQ